MKYWNVGSGYTLAPCLWGDILKALLHKTTLPLTFRLNTDKENIAVNLNFMIENGV